MFTGLIEETGRVVSLEKGSAGARLMVEAQGMGKEIKDGESVAVNGCCLTATGMEGTRVGFDLLEETLRRTNLGGLKAGGVVNLERALRADGRLGGHFVQGHVDCVSEVLSFGEAGGDWRLEVALPGEFARYVVYKGSIALNGISLTVAEVTERSFTVFIIPHTRERTNLAGSGKGDLVNLEFDLLAKYVERLLRKGPVS